MKADIARAALALTATLVLSAGAVQAAPWLKAQGYWPQTLSEPADQLYTILNLTEDVSAFVACPLDENGLRTRIENGLAVRGARGVYSPIAEGPEVLTIEAVAVLENENRTCLWQLSPAY
ncbi:MAG: hypothetical protein GYB36_10240 [Alphaproteobacteria bacterium]|nr:hypothetical protein [Alphaproteobacteria bacterium]